MVLNSIRTNVRFRWGVFKIGMDVLSLSNLENLRSFMIRSFRDYLSCCPEDHNLLNSP